MLLNTELDDLDFFIEIQLYNGGSQEATLLLLLGGRRLFGVGLGRTGAGLCRGAVREDAGDLVNKFGIGGTAFQPSSGVSLHAVKQLGLGSQTHEENDHGEVTVARSKMQRVLL